MVFQNYSQTYAAAITAFVGLLGSVLPFFGISIVEPQLQFIVGNLVNVVGIVWVILHRNSNGGVNAFGFRK